jgi:hypothetical protein
LLDRRCLFNDNIGVHIPITGGQTMKLRTQIRKSSRRTFIKWSAGIATTSVLGDIGVAAAQSNTSVAMRAIPHSNEHLPVIGLGTANDFQTRPQGAEKATLKKVVDDLLAQGCKLIDTASSYGAAESVLGDLLSDQDRTKVFLATKIEDGSKKGGLEEFRSSLDRLRYKQVDLLQQHNVQDPHQDLAPFREWKAQGLCRYIGVTTTFKNVMLPRPSSGGRSQISSRLIIRLPIGLRRNDCCRPREMSARQF